MVITDHFSRYTQAIPTKNQMAKTTACVLFDQFVVHYGFPARLHSQHSHNFVSNVIKALASLLASKNPGQLAMDRLNVSNRRS